MLRASENSRTKIVATIGPACRDPAMLRQLLDAGVDVFRLNTAHGSREQFDALAADIRRTAAEAGRIVAILVDLAGPKIRLGQLATDPVQCREGEEFTFRRGDATNVPGELVSTYAPLIDEVRPGDRVILADGTVGLQVVDKQADHVRMRALNGGTFRSRQGINLPGVSLGIAALTPSDLEFADWAAERGADFVSLSFVRRSDEINELRQRLRARQSAALLIAKIEKREALDRLEEIVSAADGVMVARGDLGVETDVAEIAVVQKRIIAECRRQMRPVIVATQMLESMHQNPRPTRAEATDVANAILDGADACMLSGETAIGQHPLAAVETMHRIMRATEKVLGQWSARLDGPASSVHPITSAVVQGAGQIATGLGARLVVIATRSGATAIVRSKLHDLVPTIGLSDCEATLRQMCLYWGITPLAGAPVHDGPALRDFIEHWGRTNDVLQAGDRVVYVTGSHYFPRAHNVVVVHEVR